MTKLVINPSKKQSKINKEIYGHFSEHLGRCIYEGIYVGEDSQIPRRILIFAGIMRGFTYYLKPAFASRNFVV